MAEPPATPGRCGIDSVEIARIERLLAQTPAGDLRRVFTERELVDAGDGAGRAASLAARFAAKEACAKLFPRETARGQLVPEDFSVATDAYGASHAVGNAAAQAAMGRHRIGRIALSLTHDATRASAVALAEPATVDVPLAGKILYRLLPVRRRVILENLRRVFGEDVPQEEIVRLAQAHYAHLWRLAGEFLRFRFMSAERKAAIVRIDNLDPLTRAFEGGKGVLVLTGHFGNWEVATAAGIGHFPHFRGRFNFVRRALKPPWLDRLVTRRFNEAGFGVFPKRGSLDAILDALGRGDFIVFPFDQHARPPDGIEVDFFGHPAWTFKSLAILALSTGAPVVPACAWREPDGRHVLHFDEPLAPVACDDPREEVRRTTQSYNETLERMILARPEQWYWVHRRWKTVPGKGSAAKATAPGA